MPRRIIIIMLALVWGVCHAEDAPTLSGYRYWYDSDVSSAQFVKSSNQDISLSLSVDNQAPGVHFLNFMAKNSAEAWGPLYRYIYYIPEVNPGTRELKSYEYWIDDNYSQHISANSRESEQKFIIDVSKLESGVHFFNYRAIDSQGGYGNLKRYIFYLPEDKKQEPTLKSYEYWMDDDYANHKSVMSTESDIAITYDISNLATGVHYFNFRAIDTNGGYGSLSRYILYIPQSINGKAELAEYECWIDDDWSGRKSGKLSQNDFTTQIDVSALESGVHFFNYRAKDNYGNWSNLKRMIFYLPKGDETRTSPIVGYRYGFNGNLQYKQVTVGTTYEMSNAVFDLPDILDMASIGDHCTFEFGESEVKMKRDNNVNFILQFCNKNNEWSSPVSEEFAIKDSLERVPVELSLNKAAEITKMKQGDFGVFKLTIDEYRDYYFKSNDECAVTLYKEDGTKVVDISGVQLKQTYLRGLDAGTYYGVVYNTVTDKDNTEETVRIRIMTTANYVPSPKISYADGKVTISDELTDATIYYTVDGSDPTTSSAVYTAPFEVTTNVTVKAMATYEDLDPSDIVSFKVNAFKVEKPVIAFANLKLYITCATENTKIYYTLDGSDPSENGQLYTEPFGILGSCTVKAVAKRDGYNNSDIVEEYVDVENVKCAMPSISFVGNKFSIASLTEGATIYYTTDGSNPTTASQKYTGEIEVTHNCVVKAIAVFDGLISSDIAESIVDWFYAETPQMSFSYPVLTMSSSTPGVKIYYTLGGDTPTAQSAEYTGPLTLTDNKVVKAIAVAENFNDSEIAEYQPTEFTCAKPTIEYDGRSILLASATDGATIYYTIDGSEPIVAESAEAVGEILLDGLCTVKAVAVKADMNNSEGLVFELPAYYNGATTYVAKAGSLMDAYKWSGTSGLTTMTVEGNLNADDIAAIRQLSQLEQLNLTDAEVEGRTLADEALAGMNLIVFHSPNNLTEVGKNLLKDVKTLGAIVWNAYVSVPNDILGGVAHPNMLLYVKQSGLANADVFPNIVSNGVAATVTLVDAAECGNFFCPENFTATKITYTHKYGMKTEKNKAAGWETIVLPFNVKTVTHKEKGECAPFAANDQNRKPFWLRSLKDDFVDEAQIKANVPYIIAMPNNEAYSDEYILEGEVTFSAENAEVVNSYELNNGTMGEYSMVPNYLYRQKDNKLMALNVYESYNGYSEGSIFVSELRDIKPFEAYITSEEVVPGANFSIDRPGTTGLDDMPQMYKGTKIYSKNGKLYIYSNGDGEMRLYNAGGQLYKVLILHDGLNEISDISKGVYFSRGIKVIVD